MNDENFNPAPTKPEDAVREVRYEYSRDFLPVLQHAGCSLLISTYQAGKLVAVGVHDDQVAFSFHNFEQAMGIALAPQRIAVGAGREIWFLENANELAGRVEPAGQHDACWLTRRAFVTGNIHGHEMNFAGDALWIVNTLFSSLCTLHDDFNFVPRWQPKFISALAAEDRCHLNGLAMHNGRPAYVTAMSETDEAGGWRPNKATGGVLIDVDSKETVASGFSMPHSPRLYADRLWVLDSGKGQLVTVDPASGHCESVDSMPGYTRGLAFCGQFAFIGLSKIRETAVFGGVPIAEKRDELRCGVAIVDLQSGRSVAYVEFLNGVDEIFDVQVLPGTRFPAISGPYITQDGTPEVWVVPRPGQVNQLVASKSSAIGQPAAAPPAPLDEQNPRALDAAGLVLHEQGRIDEAIACFRKALTQDPRLATAHNNLGNVLQAAGDQEQAEACYRAALELRDDLVPAHQNLGYLLKEQGYLDAAKQHLRRAQELGPNNVIRLLLTSALPPVYASLDDLQHRRQQLEDGIRSLVAEGFAIDLADTTAPTMFYAAYHGHNDVELQRTVAKIYQAPQPTLAPRKPNSQRIRVGFLSRYFRNHTIGRLNLGVISQLPRDEFEVTVISPAGQTDEMSEQFRSAADNYVQPPASPAAARQMIAALGLDILWFSDVGMDPLTYTLSFSRLAPVQCASWGHPITTGSPAIDYFVSSQLLETEDAEEHYTEELVQLPTLGVYYYRPAVPSGGADRADFGLSPDAHLYLCPQTLFKFHPEFDSILGEILRRDPAGQLVLLEGRYPRWTELLRERFANTMEDVCSRITWLPAQPQADFLRLNAVADVVLDPIHFGGGNTSYEALAVGVPVVTLPGQFLRSRITQALYKQMQLTDCIASDAASYIETAVRLASDRDYAGTIRAMIRTQSDLVFEQTSAVDDIAEFLKSKRP